MPEGNIDRTRIAGVRFVLQRVVDGKFYAFDRHGDAPGFWAEYGTPFVCEWDRVADVPRTMFDSVVRVVIFDDRGDGELV
jgi:hypothetical protein